MGPGRRCAATLARSPRVVKRTTQRKLGYLHCTVDAQKAVPTAIRPALPQAVARMLKDYGFAE